MHPVVRKLSIFSDLPPGEMSAVALALSNIVRFDAGVTFAREDDPPDWLYFLIEGLVCRHKSSADGQRQVLAFMFPGDPCDIGVTLLERRDHSLSTLTECRLARLSENAYQHLCETYPRLRAAMQWATLTEESVAREWLLNVGQRPALARMAHLFCEIYHRMSAIGQVDGLNVAMPVSQTVLGDAIGITPVHSNRVIQELRARRLIRLSDGRLTILSLQGLEEAGGFDRAYLHLDARYAGEQHSA